MKYVITNYVASMNLEFDVDLGRMYEAERNNSTKYDPEKFPALSCKINDKMVLIFPKGKVIFNASTDILLENTARKIESLCSKYKMVKA